MAKVQVTEAPKAASPNATGGAGDDGFSFSQEVLPYLTRLGKIQETAAAGLQKDVELAQNRHTMRALADAFDLGFRTALEEAVRNPGVLDRFRRAGAAMPGDGGSHVG